MKVISYINVDAIIEGRETLFDCLIEEEGDLETLLALESLPVFSTNFKTIKELCDFIASRCTSERGIRRDLLNHYIDDISTVNPYLALALESYIHWDGFPERVKRFKESLAKKLTKRMKEIEFDKMRAEYEFNEQVEHLEKSFKEAN